MVRESDSGNDDAVEVRPRAVTSDLRCPYCHAGFEDSKKTDECRSCSALHHRRCLREHGACASCGEAARVAAPPPRDVRRERARAYVADARSRPADPLVEARTNPTAIRFVGVFEVALCGAWLALGHPEDYVINGIIPLNGFLWFILGLGVVMTVFPQVIVAMNEASGYGRRR